MHHEDSAKQDWYSWFDISGLMRSASAAVAEAPGFDWNAGGNVMAYQDGGDGTAAHPARTYLLDPDTGAYRVGANNEGFSAGGVLRWDYNTSRLKLSSGYTLDWNNTSISELDIAKIGGITNGVGAAGKALVLDANADVTSGLRDLTGRNITATGALSALTLNTFTFNQSVASGASPAFTTITGNLVGNVTGNVTGSSGSTTGNAATATALQNARTIAGVSFNGTANIAIPSTGLSDTSNLAYLNAALNAFTTAMTVGTTLGVTGNFTVGSSTFVVTASTGALALSGDLTLLTTKAVNFSATVNIKETSSNVLKFRLSGIDYFTLTAGSGATIVGAFTATGKGTIGALNESNGSGTLKVLDNSSPEIVLDGDTASFWAISFKSGGATVATWGVSAGVSSFSTPVTAAGVLTVNGFGTHAFSAGGAGVNSLRIRNSTAGAANYSEVVLGNDTSATRGYLEMFSSTYTPVANIAADGLLMQCDGAGGLTLGSGHASGAIKFSSGGSSERMRLLADGKFGIGTTTPQTPFVVSNAGAAGIEFAPSTGIIQSYNRSTVAFAPMVLDGSTLTFKIASLAALTIAATGAPTFNAGATSGYLFATSAAKLFAHSSATINTLYSGTTSLAINNQADAAALVTLTNAGALRLHNHVAGTPTRAAGDKYLLVDASGFVHVSADGPAT